MQTKAGALREGKRILKFLTWGGGGKLVSTNELDATEGKKYNPWGKRQKREKGWGSVMRQGQSAALSVERQGKKDRSSREKPKKRRGSSRTSLNTMRRVAKKKKN